LPLDLIIEAYTMFGDDVEAITSHVCFILYQD